MAVAGNSNGAVDDCANEGPDEAGDFLGVAGEDEEREGERVDVGTIIADDRESEDDDAEIAKGAEVGDENLME